MHEHSIAVALLDEVLLAAAPHAGARVREVHVALGELSGVEPELLEVAFSVARAGTIAAEATLEIRRVAADWRCPRCGLAIPAGRVLRCPACDVPARLEAGGELVLARLELEVPDV